MSIRFLSGIVAWSLVASAAVAQVDVEQDTVFIYIPTFDTTEVYRLGELTVGGDRTPSASDAMTQRISLAQIENRDAFSASEIMRIVPAAHIQTNSRGESLVYLRNAGERQVAMFFDGAPLNIPWDNRVDLSFIPASVLQNLNVVKGAPSLLYGPNTLGGVVNMVSRELEANGQNTEITSQIGSPQRGRILLTHLMRDGHINAMGTVGFSGSSGFSVPSGADLPFGQEEGALRTNTDANIKHGFFRLEYDLPYDGRASFAFLHVSGEKGVAPEGHKDPEVSKVRYWRYPDWHNTLVIGSGEWKTRSSYPTTIRASVWGGRFGQTIEQYPDSEYRRVSETQQDRDRSIGARVIIHKPLPVGSLRLAAIGWTARHKQTNTDEEESRDCCTVETAYKQHTASFGGEYEASLTQRSNVFAGVNLDVLQSPASVTGDTREAKKSVGWSGGVSWRLTSGWRAKGRIGSRTRFPTMRERFDTALGKFVLNPDLKPERSYVAEIGIDRRSGGLASEIVLFGGYTRHTIDQEVVTVEGQKLRRRINLDGSRLVGIEWTGSARANPALGIEAHVTATHGRAYDADTQSYSRKLQERPNLIGRAAVLSSLPARIRFIGELELAGQAYSLDEDNVLVPLGWAPRIHIRLSRLFDIPAAFPLYAEVFARADNLTDTAYTPQIGLPEPGRTIQAGIKLSM